LITIDKESQENCGFHSVATVSFGPNKKVERALGPECGEELTTTPLPCGKASVTPRVPINPAGLKQRLQKYIDGEIIPTEDDIVKGIHILDMDFTDVDNSTAMLTLQKALTNCNNKHPLFVFVSVRKMSAKLSPLQLHMGEKGPIKTDQGKVQFKICNGNPNQYVLTDNLGPILKEQAYESHFHSDRDMTALHNYAAAVLVRQLKLQNPNNTTQVGTLGRFEIAGKYSKRRRSNVAVIIDRIVFISLFLFYCLLLNHSFPTNPNRITNCLKLILFLFTTLITTLLNASLF